MSMLLSCMLLLVSVWLMLISRLVLGGMFEWWLLMLILIYMLNCLLCLCLKVVIVCVVGRLLVMIFRL